MPKRELTAEELALRERLGRHIRARSAALGIKPAELAAAAGVALSQQYRIEAGELTADFLYLMKVAALLETGVDDLIHSDGTPATKPRRPTVGSAGVRIGAMTQHASEPGAVQVGYAGGAVTVGGGRKSRRKPG